MALRGKGSSSSLRGHYQFLGGTVLPAAVVGPRNSPLLEDMAVSPMWRWEARGMDMRLGYLVGDTGSP